MPGQVRPHFSDAELVELTAISELFSVSNRIRDTIQLPIVKGSLKVYRRGNAIVYHRV